MGPPASGRVPRALPYSGYRWGGAGLRLRGSHPLRPGFPARSPSLRRPLSRSHNPGEQAPRFGLARVRSPLLAGSLLFSSPAGTEMFHFPASRPPALCVQAGVIPHEGYRVAPFGNPRIKACLPLPVAYRSLPRPSSPRDAKASVVRPYALGRAAAPSGRRRGAPRYVATLPFPDFGFQRSKFRHPPRGEILPAPAGVVGVPGVEPGTSSLSGTRSNQLSYTPFSGEFPVSSF